MWSSKFKFFEPLPDNLNSNKTAAGMQNRYVGDIGDFAKYALLRTICRNTDLRLGILWCLFADESHNSDGRHTIYLQRGEFCSLDMELHDRLHQVVRSDRRSIQQVVRAKIFPANTIYFNALISPMKQVRLNSADRETHRKTWMCRALTATDSCDIVFFDPDNGLETSSIPKHARKAGKYIFWDELRPFWTRGQSLIVYHHLNRTAPAHVQTQRLKARFQAEMNEPALLLSLLFRRGSCRHFWVVGQEQHAPVLRAKMEAMLASGWAEHFEVG
jgi:hypothetical protein